tara:strand:- start:1051 stop:1725 length:675 start_codon:yes stop_codon:yes gene_type:complete
MLLSGTFVSVPLLILQENAHHLHTSHWIASSDILPTMAVNILMSHAVYDADRVKERVTDDTIRDAYDLTTSSAMVLTSLFFQQQHKEALIPLIFILHKRYAELKPYVASVKPFFVSLCWSIAVCCIPDASLDATTFMSTLLQMSAWSNVADIEDIEEDKTNNLNTPAVRLGTTPSYLVSILCICASIVLHTNGTFYDSVDQSYDFLNLFIMCILFNQAFNQAIP